MKFGRIAPSVPSQPIEEIRAELGALLPRLWRYGLVLSQSRDVAEELAQAACLRALERAHQFQPGSHLDRWLFSIMYSIWINELRARKVRFGQGVTDAAEVALTDTAASAETRLYANQLIGRINALPEAQRTTVFLAYVEGLSYREVAETLAIPIGTVMSRLSNARARLSEEMGHNRDLTLHEGGA